MGSIKFSLQREVSTALFLRGLLAKGATAEQLALAGAPALTSGLRLQAMRLGAGRARQLTGALMRGRVFGPAAG